jgi:hypothetical protein
MDEQLNEQSPVDFSSLGPPISADRFNALVAAATRRGEAELERRRSGGERTVVRVVLAWRRPVLALAGLAHRAQSRKNSAFPPLTPNRLKEPHRPVEDR